jgi:thioredoxin-like negative regulator of GroEL
MSDKVKPFWFVIMVAVGVMALVVVSKWMSGREIIPWRTDFTAAQDEASKASKPRLLYFTATWCGPCQRMKATTWSDTTVEAALQKYVPVKIDIDEHPDLARQYRIEAIPTMVLVGTDGMLVRSTTGGMSSQEFLSWLKG